LRDIDREMLVSRRKASKPAATYLEETEMLVSRKEASKPAATTLEETQTVSENTPLTSTELEEGAPSLDSPAPVTNNSNKFSSKVTRVINRIKTITLYEVNIFLFVIVVLLFTLLVIAPAHVKEKRNKVLNSQLLDISTSLMEQKASLSKKYEYLQKTLNSDNDHLIADLYEMVGLVSKEHHDEALTGKESTIQSLVKVTAEAKDTMNKKQTEIDWLKAEILKNKGAMDKLKSSLQTIDVKPENFCAECIMETMPGVSCGTRRDYFLSHHKSLLQDALNAIVKASPSCYKVS